MKVIRYRNDFSFFPKGSPSWAIIKATNIFRAARRANQHVFHPAIKNKGAINSAIVHRIKEAVGPIPIGSPKLRFS